jgi:uncharacterized protein YukE
VTTKTGMDADAVRNLASKLDGEATRLSSAISHIDSLMSQVQSMWRGADAQRHVGWWQQQHRPQLMQAHQAIAGLAQSARNNASDQDQTSATGGASGHAVGSTSPVAPLAAAAIATAGVVGAASGALTPSTEAAAFYAEHAGQSMPTNGHGGWMAETCVAYALLRRTELHLPAPSFGTDGMPTIGDPHNPTLGAYAWYGNQTNGSGHAMIVEQVTRDASGRATQVVVSEANSPPGSLPHRSALTVGPDGTFLHNGHAVLFTT